MIGVRHVWNHVQQLLLNDEILEKHFYDDVSKHDDRVILEIHMNKKQRIQVENQSQRDLNLSIKRTKQVSYWPQPLPLTLSLLKSVRKAFFHLGRVIAALRLWLNDQSFHVVPILVKLMLAIVIIA